MRGRQHVCSNEAILKITLLSLNNDIPEQFGQFWLTLEEIQQYVVHSSVNRYLELSLPKKQ